MSILTKTLRVVMCGALTLQLTGCGTLLYPERKGQTAGRIDSGVAILDGIGLLLFIIPGVIAFAVDFNNGTIYLPGTHKSSLESPAMKHVRFDPHHSDAATIAKLVKEQTGKDVALDQPGISITRLDSKESIGDHLVFLDGQ